MRLDVDEGVREREQRGHKGCLCFKQHSDLRNVPLGHSRELPTANNALNVSYGWLAQTLLALLQGPNSSKMMDTGNSIPQESLFLPSPPAQRMETLCASTKDFQTPTSSLFQVVLTQL